VKAKALLNLRLRSEDVSDFAHQPTKRSQVYQIVALRKNISREKGDLMQFKTFLNAFMLIPCQLVRQSRKLIFRLLSWNSWQEVLLRFVRNRARTSVTDSLQKELV